MFQRKLEDDNDFELRLTELTKKVVWLERELKNKVDICPVIKIEPEPEPELEPESESVGETEFEPVEQNHVPITEDVLEQEPEIEKDFREVFQPEDHVPITERVLEEESLLSLEKGDKEPFSFEKHIGLCWLNRIGTISLVLGVALFIIYSFHDLGPFLKLSVGALTGIGLLVWGEIFERNRQFQTLSLADKFWGRSLMGGGWALIYFTGYAAYHITDVKILSNLLIEDLLLTTICLSALKHASGKNSQVMATMVILLSFVTISISEIGIGTVYWILALGVRAMPVCTAMNWFPLLLLTTFLGYGSYTAVVEPNMPAHLSGDFNNIAKLFGMTLFWISCNRATIAVVCQKQSEKRLIAVTTFLNGICITSIATGLLQHLQGAIQLDYLAPLVIGTFYCLTYRPFLKPAMVSLASLRLFMGMISITYALSLAGQTPEWQTNYWLIEIALFVGIGARFEISLMRSFAYALASYVGLQKFELVTTAPYQNAALNAIFTSAIFFACWQLHKKNKFLRQIHGRNYLFGLFQLFAWFVPFATFLSVYQGSCEAELIGQTLGWLVLYSAFLQVCLRSNDPMWRLATIIGFAVTGGYSMQIAHNPLVASIVVATYLISALICQFNKKALGDFDSKALYRIFIAGCAILAWFHTQSQDGFSTNLIALKWSVESLVLIGIGYWLKDSFTRYLGFLGFVLVMVSCLANSSSLNASETQTIIAILYALGQLYRKTHGKHLHKDELVLANYFEAAGTLLTTITIWQLAPAQWVPLSLASQSLLLLLAGILLRDKPFLVWAMAASFLWGIKSLLMENSLISSVALVSIVSTQALITRISKKRIGSQIAITKYKFYSASAAIVCGAHTYFYNHGDFNYLSLKWAAGATVVFIVGYWLRDAFTRKIANIWFAIITLFLICRIGPWHGAEITVIVTLFYAIGLVYRFSPNTRIEQIAKPLSHYFEVSASVLTSFALWELMPREWLTASLALQGFSLLITGFLLPDKLFRFSGLAAFLLLGTKLLIDDLLGARTDIRILSVIWAGAVLLTSSFMYAKWGRRLKVS